MIFDTAKKIRLCLLAKYLGSAFVLDVSQVKYEAIFNSCHKLLNFYCRLLNFVDITTTLFFVA